MTPRTCRAPFPASAPDPGAVRISASRSGRLDRRYSVGLTFHALKVRDAGGGPDGKYYTVLASHMLPPCEDNQQFSWAEEAWVRPATDAEAAPVAARIEAKATRDVLVHDLGQAGGEHVSRAMPGHAVTLVPCDPGAKAITGQRIAIVDGAIMYERWGDPDMCDSWYRYSVRIENPTPELLARVEAFITGQSQEPAT